jgi:hypothetical protein
MKRMSHVRSATTRGRDRVSLLASAVPVAEGALRRSRRSGPVESGTTTVDQGQTWKSRSGISLAPLPTL